MKVLIKIECSNSEFEDNASYGVARILKSLAKRIEGHPNFSEGHEQPLTDINGNEVGFISCAEDSTIFEM